jgi:hypothetical protein
MGPRNAYKDMLDNVVSPITCVSMNHQNQLEQMANGAMFATLEQLVSGFFLVREARLQEAGKPHCERERRSECYTDTQIAMVY